MDGIGINLHPASVCMYGASCGREKCAKLGYLLRNILSRGEVTSSALFPHGIDFLSRLTVAIRSAARGAPSDLLRVLKQRDIGARLALLLCGLLLPQEADSLCLPPASHCKQLVDFVCAFRCARTQCYHAASSLWAIPPHFWEGLPVPQAVFSILVYACPWFFLWPWRCLPHLYAMPRRGLLPFLTKIGADQRMSDG